MITTLKLFLLLVAALSALYALGPRVGVTPPTATATVPPDLDQFLIESEAGFTDVTPGTEKAIAWANPAEKNRTPVALVYIHGFSATRMETEPLTSRVGESLGANIYFARLTGHGRGSAAMSEASAGDWLADTREAFDIGRRLGERVVVIGVSTGATLAAWLALQNETDALHGLVMISPNFALADSAAQVLNLPWGIQIASLFSGASRSFEPSNEAHGKYWTVSYGIDAAGELMALVKYVNGLNLHAIETPLLYIRSDRDTVIDMAAADNFFVGTASARREKIIVTNSNDPYGHVVAGDILSPDTTDQLAGQITGFVRSLRNNGDPELQR